MRSTVTYLVKPSCRTSRLLTIGTSITCHGQPPTSNRAPCTVINRLSINISSRVSAPHHSKTSPPHQQQSSSVSLPRMNKASALSHTRSGLPQASSNTRLQPALHRRTLGLMHSALLKLKHPPKAKRT